MCIRDSCYPPCINYNTSHMSEWPMQQQQQLYRCLRVQHIVDYINYILRRNLIVMITVMKHTHTHTISDITTVINDEILLLLRTSQTNNDNINIIPSEKKSPVILLPRHVDTADIRQYVADVVGHIVFARYNQWLLCLFCISSDTRKNIIIVCSFVTNKK